MSASREHEPLAGDESDRPLLLATSVLIVTTVGKELLPSPSMPLLAAGLAHLALMLAVPAATHRGGRRLSRLLLLFALLAGLISVYITDNGTLLLAVSVIPFVARYESMVFALLSAVLMAATTVLVSVAAGHTLVDLLQYLGSYVGGGAFLLAYAGVMARERKAREALAGMAEVREQLAREGERLRINQAIHDGVGHYLSAAALQLEATRVTRERDPLRSGENLQRARELLHHAMQAVRQGVTALRDAPKPAALTESIAELLSVHREAGIASEFTQSGPTRPLAPAVVLAVYQGVREGLSNVRRHAQAKNTHVSISYNREGVRVRVEDDGVGVGVATRRRRRGRGRRCNGGHGSVGYPRAHRDPRRGGPHRVGARRRLRP